MVVQSSHMSQQIRLHVEPFIANVTVEWPFSCNEADTYYLTGLFYQIPRMQTCVSSLVNQHAGIGRKAFLTNGTCFLLLLSCRCCRVLRIGSNGFRISSRETAVVGNGQFRFGVRALHMAYPFGRSHKVHGAEITFQSSSHVSIVVLQCREVIFKQSQDFPSYHATQAVMYA